MVPDQQHAGRSVYSNIDPDRMKYIEAIQTVAPTTVRQPLGPQHKTEHYQITEWIAPYPGMPYHLFTIAGPGEYGKIFVGNDQFCGPDFIKALERAWLAGWNERSNSLA